MSQLDDFKSKFDEEGRFRNRDGTQSVVFAMKGGGRFPGKLQFSNGLCVRAEMEGGGDWGHPDNSPIHGIRFLLDFGDERLHEVAIDQGRVIQLDEAKSPLAKRDFLGNLRVARNLFVHPQRVEADSASVDTAAIADNLVRAAIWLTPRSVAGFNADDFPELGSVRQAELQTAVQSFRAVATQVPAGKPATREQFGNARIAFARILEILAPYLPVPDEAERVEAGAPKCRLPAMGGELGLRVGQRFGRDVGDLGIRICRRTSRPQSTTRAGGLRADLEGETGFGQPSNPPLALYPVEDRA